LYQSVTTEVLATFSAIWLQTGYESMDQLGRYLSAYLPASCFLKENKSFRDLISRWFHLIKLMCQKNHGLLDSGIFERGNFFSFRALQLKWGL
jgi:hypothetical protein